MSRVCIARHYLHYVVFSEQKLKKLNDFRATGDQRPEIRTAQQRPFLFLENVTEKGAIVLF